MYILKIASKDVKLSSVVWRMHYHF